MPNGKPLPHFGSSTYWISSCTELARDHQDLYQRELVQHGHTMEELSRYREKEEERELEMTQLKEEMAKLKEELTIALVSRVENQIMWPSCDLGQPKWGGDATKRREGCSGGEVWPSDCPEWHAPRRGGKTFCQTRNVDRRGRGHCPGRHAHRGRWRRRRGGVRCALEVRPLVGADTFCEEGEGNSRDQERDGWVGSDSFETGGQQVTAAIVRCKISIARACWCYKGKGVWLNEREKSIVLIILWQVYLSGGKFYFFALFY